MHLNMLKKKIRICQICAVDFTFENFLQELIKSQKRIGWEVTCLSSKGKYLNKLKKSGFKTKSINIQRDFNLSNKLHVIINLYKYLKKQNFDFVHTHTPLVSILVRIACIFIRRTKVIYTAHGFYFHENMNFFSYNFFFILEKIFSYFTNLTFLQSKEDFKIASQNFFKRDKIFYIGNGIDLNKFNLNKVNKKNIKTLKKKYKIHKNSFIAGMVCRLVKDKGIVEFLEASYFFSKHNSNFKAILIGERLSNEHSKSINLIIKKYKKLMRDKLILTGSVNNVQDYLAIFTIFCLPSYREGLPRSIIEAMAMKLPVIATNIRGCRELVKDKVNGYLVSVKDSKSIYSKMKVLEGSKKIRKKMGNLNCKNAVTFHNEKKIVLKQIKLIKQFIR